MSLNALALRAKAEQERRRRKAKVPDIIKKYIDPDPVRWIQTHFYIPETNSPMELFSFQQAGLREALAIDEDGLYRYSTVVWSAIKKSAKSSIAGAVVILRGFLK